LKKLFETIDKIFAFFVVIQLHNQSDSATKVCKELNQNILDMVTGM